MLFSRQISQSSLIEFCRALRHNLDAGLPIVRVLRQQGERGPLAVRSIAVRVSNELEKGESFTVALKAERAYFPPLFLSLTSMGEETGHLPEICGELEKYYIMQQRLWRQFVARITWPVLQFVASVFIIALMLLVLGIIADIKNTKDPIDPIGLGLGPAGALRWLTAVSLSLALLFGGYLLATRSLKGRARVDSALLRIPVIGPTLMALALTRFCLALRLTLETGMPITHALRLSLRATNNAAFEAAAGNVKKKLMEGRELAQALAMTRLFPPTFVDIVAVAEEGGRVPEVMRKQADAYEEELHLRLAILSRFASFGVWFIVAALIVFAIFRIFMTIIAPAYGI